MGGSQLKQLKSRLKDSGLSRSSHGKKKKTKSNSGASSARDGADVRQAKLASISSEFNVFDLKVTKNKHSVITGKAGSQQQKNGKVAGKPSLSKQTAIEQRRKTLLPELKDRNRAGGIIDRRFGENNPHLTPEERSLERFTKERQRLAGEQQQATARPSSGKRGRLYNLEEEDELTHLGRSLGAGDDTFTSDNLAGQDQAFAQFKRSQSAPMSEEDDDQPSRKRSRADIMNEVVAKSKFHKFERQKVREEDEELRLQLDDELADLRAVLGQSARPQKKAKVNGHAASASVPKSASPPPTEEVTMPAQQESKIDRALLAKIIGSPSPEPEKKIVEANDMDEDEDDFDRYVRELAFEKRAKPSNRLQTEEEQAREAKEELEASERARQRRMQGLPDESDSENENGKRKAQRAPQADDLDDDFDVGLEEDEYGFGEGLTEAGAWSLAGADAASGSENGVEETASESGDESEDSQSAEGSLDSDEHTESEEESVGEEKFEGFDEDELEEEVDGAEEQELLSQPKLSIEAKGKRKASNTNLAYTFPCPATHSEFLELVGDSEASELQTVVERVRVLYHTSLAAENKDKLAAFLGVLIDHVIFLSAQAPPSIDAINTVAPHILSLSNAYPIPSAQHFITKLSIMQKNFVRGLNKGPLNPESKTWPGLPELNMLRLIGLIWSTSDLSHPVVAPALIFICQILGQARIRSVSDIASGAMLCTLALQYEALSKRLVPELMNFLFNSLLLLAPHRFTASNMPGSFLVQDGLRQELASLKISKATAIQVSEKLNISVLLTARSISKEDRATLLSTVIKLFSRIAQMYASTEACIELLSPALRLFEGVDDSQLPTSIKSDIGRIKDDLSRITKLATQSRKPLRLQQHRAVPIATYLPKFEDGYRPGSRAFDPDTSRNESAKLKALVRKEKKGAIRELRKDNRFIATEQARIRQEKDEAYKQKISSIRSGLQDERAEEKAFLRAKQKLKARDKRRGGS